MKKFKGVKNSIALLLLIAITASSGGNNVVHAQTDTLPMKHIEVGNVQQWGNEHCPGMQTCNGCTAYDCDVYKVQHISTSYTSSQCRKVANKAGNISTWGGLSSIAAGFAAPIPAAIFGVYTMSVGNAYKMFEKAADKDYGLKFSYDYVISKTSYSMNVYRNGTVSYIK